MGIDAIEVNTYNGGPPSTPNNITTLFEQDVISTAGIAGLKVYPNPAQGMLTVEGGSNGAGISIVNIMGQQMYAPVVGSLTDRIFRVNVSKFPEGIYILMVYDRTRSVKTFRFVIAR